MHLKKTKKTPRMFRMIALMLSLVLAFFTMTGMALSEEGTDVSDAAPDSTLEIVETELEVEPEPTEEPPAETPGAEETPEPTPEPEEPSIPPEPTDTPALEPDYELDAEIPSGWHNTPVTITVRLLDKNNTGWGKIEVAFSDEDDADRFDVMEEWNEWGHARSRYFLVSQVNPGLVDLLVSRVRKELAKAKNAPAKHSSVLEMIQKNKTASHAKSAEKKLLGQER